MEDLIIILGLGLSIITLNSVTLFLVYKNKKSMDDAMISPSP